MLFFNEFSGGSRGGKKKETGTRRGEREREGKKKKKKNPGTTHNRAILTIHIIIRVLL